MKFNVENVLLMLILLSFGFTSINTLILDSNLVTQEEAIAISKNTPIVREALSKGGASIPTAEHWNASFIRSIKENYPNAEEFRNLPEEHGVWRIFWNIMPGYLILHFIDESTGSILFEAVAYVG